ncbi:metalloregulator ArsR/SmtB family transcription factor [Candidatus Riflebacteria bacterium]
MNVKVLKVLANETRLLIINALMDKPLYPELLAERLDLSPSTVSFHLKKLEAAGLVKGVRDQYYFLYSLNSGIFEQPLKELLRVKDSLKRSQEAKEVSFKKKVIKTFFKNGKLLSIPRARKKRQIILQKLLERFESGRDYPEKEVNLIIADFHEDFCTIRREFIMWKMMRRENGIYTRNETNFKQ